MKRSLLCSACPPPVHGLRQPSLALPNSHLCADCLRDKNRKQTAGALETADEWAPFTLEQETARIESVEIALYGLDMATALRVLEFVRSRVVGNNGGFR